jgi:hypothetical protein
MTISIFEVVTPRVGGEEEEEGGGGIKMMER